MDRQRYALLGWPVSHSVSPQMQEAGFRALGIDAVYEPIACPPAKLDHTVQRLIHDRYQGWNITVPLKYDIIPCLDVVDPDAARAGSVNTVRNLGGALHGYSTDGYGLARSVEEAFGLTIADCRFTFWGTGGAARATSTYFAAKGAKAIVLVNRTLDRAIDLADAIRASNPQCRVSAFSPDSVDLLEKAIGKTDVIIQATSIGLRPEDPIAIPSPLIACCPNFLDMIYHPTAALHEAKRLGCNTADGRGMLLYQGVRSLALWTDRDPPVEAMRRALDQALEHR